MSLFFPPHSPAPLPTQLCSWLTDWLREPLINSFRTADETFSFLAWCRQRPQTKNFRSRRVLSFLCSVCWSNRRFPSKGNYSGTHLRNYVFGARKPCRIDDLLPLNFRTQMVSPIQNILMNNLETICRVILAKTSQKMIVNLLMMV